MTTIYNTYYPNIQDGKINLTKVNFSAYVVDSTYMPDEAHKKADVTGRVITLRQVLVEGDISTLTMSEIIEKVKEKLVSPSLKPLFACLFQCHSRLTRRTTLPFGSRPPLGWIQKKASKRCNVTGKHNVS